jgi:ATP-dependent Zn protease
MGGRAAEELIFGEAQVTTGAGSDFNQATQLATRMVTQFGMSDKVGKIYYEPRDLEKLSPELQNLINSEIKKLLDEAYDRARNTLIKHGDELETLAQALLKEETLTVDQIKRKLGYDENLKESPYRPEQKTNSGSGSGNERKYRPRKDSDTNSQNYKKPATPQSALPNLM